MRATSLPWRVMRPSSPELMAGIQGLALERIERGPTPDLRRAREVGVGRTVALEEVARGAGEELVVVDHVGQQPRVAAGSQPHADDGGGQDGQHEGGAPAAGRHRLVDPAPRGDEAGPDLSGHGRSSPNASAGVRGRSTRTTPGTISPMPHRASATDVTCSLSMAAPGIVQTP